MHKKSLKIQLTESTGIPKDVVLGLPMIRIIGCEEVYIENYRGILEYTDSLIRIQSRIGQIHIVGKRLEIVHYSNEEMKVTGMIQKLEFIQGGNLC